MIPPCVSLFLKCLTPLLKFVRELYMHFGQEVLKYKAHRDPLVRATVVSLIPTLAMYDVTLFTDYFMHPSMAHLLSLLDKPSDLRGKGSQIHLLLY
jgi:hypothetical protein